MATVDSGIITLVVLSDIEFNAYGSPSDRYANEKDKIVIQCVVIGGVAPFTYKLYKDDIEVVGETSGVYTIDSAVVADAGVYYWEVTDDEGRVIDSLSSVITIYPYDTYTTNASIEFGTVEYRIGLQRDIKTEYSLAMIPLIDPKGFITWRSKTANYDHCVSDISFVVDDIEEAKRIALQDWLVGVSWEANAPILKVDSDIFPLSPRYDFTSGVNIGMRKVSIEKSGDISRTWDNYKMQIEPVVLSTVPISTTIPCCPHNITWTMMGIGLTEPTFEPAIRFVHNNRQLNSGIDSNNNFIIADNEITAVTVIVSFEVARLLLAQIIAVRGGTFTVDIPSPYIPFGVKYQGNTSFQCVLASNKVILNQKGFNEMEMRFDIQKRAIL